MTRKIAMLLAAAGSLLLLVGAFIFQALGYLPCQMCLWQRYPHAVAIAIGVLALVVPARVLAWLGAAAMATTAGIGIYHTGVERHWWLGPSSCTSSGGLDGLTGGDLLTTEGPRLILCDQVSWEFLMLSMPSWNAVFSLALMAIWIFAAMRKS